MGDRERETFRLLTDPESDPILKAMLDVRLRAASSFTPEFSGQRFEDYDRGLLDALKAAQQAMITALADRLEQRSGWVMVPRKALPAMLERAAFNLCAEYGVEFVKPLGKFVEDAYEELVSAAMLSSLPPAVEEK
ncbi:MAG: hypothetical protein WAW13_00545 [Minisyncoccia bacterium]